ncbi:hypothetical protein [Actinopolyspora saharensis]|uniref:hypothetical protein n=1 Tax=Actinopolyspora saharensis TaxID=995062 RepID=UPI003F66C97F
MPHARGNAETARTMLAHLLGYLAKHPLRRAYYFSALVDPSSYREICAYAPRMWPTPWKELPPDARELMDTLITDLNLDREVAQRHPYPLVHVGWRTRAPGSGRTDESSRRDDPTTFFHHANPDHRDGTGLVTVVALRKRDAAIAATRFTRRTLHHTRVTIPWNRIPHLGLALAFRISQALPAATRPRLTRGATHSKGQARY